MSSERLSVCLSVMLVDHDHIGWKSWTLIARTISPTSLLFIAQRSSTYLLTGEHGEIFGRKCLFNTYVHNIQLNWVNRVARDLRWRCGCLFMFTFVCASHGHLCDSTAFLFYNVPYGSMMLPQKPHCSIVHWLISPLCDVGCILS